MPWPQLSAFDSVSGLGEVFKAVRMGQNTSKRAARPGPTVSKSSSRERLTKLAVKKKGDAPSITPESIAVERLKGVDHDAKDSKPREPVQALFNPSSRKVGSLDNIPSSLQNGSSMRAGSSQPNINSHSMTGFEGVKHRQRRQTAPDMRHSVSLGHISERAPLSTGSTVGSDSSIFYTDFHQEASALEAAKTLRQSMRMYGKKMVAKAAEKSSESKSFKRRSRSLKPDVQSNSTSTLFVDQTVSHPDLDQILRCSATAIHMTFVWVLAEPTLPLYDAIFDEKEHPLTNQRVPSQYKSRCPPVTEIYDFLRAFFRAAVLKADVAIVGMVYITRLHNAGLVLQPGNWKRVVLGAVMMASKVWDDQAVWNADYCTVLPDVTVDSMNQLERVMLDLLFYNVSVSSAEYVQHYLDLRLYAHKADVTDGIKLSPLDVRRAKQLEALSSAPTTWDNPTAMKRAPSTDQFEMPMRHAVLP